MANLTVVEGTSMPASMPGAVLTGAAGGIGVALAHALVAQSQFLRSAASQQVLLRPYRLNIILENEYDPSLQNYGTMQRNWRTCTDAVPR